jgi:hypothetical protein
MIIKRRQIPVHFIEKCAYINNLNQIYGSGIEMCFVVRNGVSFKQVHPWVLCKDYLNDIVWANINSKKANIYGLEYDPNTSEKISLDKILVAVRDPTNLKDFYTTRSRAGGLLKAFESKHGFDKTKVFRATVELKKSFNKSYRYTNSQMCVYESDKRWMLSVPLLSLYTLLLRIGTLYNSKMSLEEFYKYIKANFIKISYSQQQNDIRYFETFWEQSSELLLNKGTKLFEDSAVDNYNEDNIHSIHDNGLICWSNLVKSRFSTVLGFNKTITSWKSKYDMLLSKEA